MKKYLLLSVLILSFLIPGGAGQAQEKSWFFNKWDVGIQVNQDASIMVQEGLTYNFTGDFSYIKRRLPKTKGIKYDNISVLETDGSRLSEDKVEIEETSSEVIVTVHFNLSNTTHTWIFEYTAYGAIGFFEDYDELYWNVVAFDREVEIKKSQATVYLPQEIDPDNIKQKIYVGRSDSKEETLDYTAGSREINFFATDIAPYENFTIVLGWPKNIVKYPGYLNITSEPESSNIYIDGQALANKTPANLLIGYDINAGEKDIAVKKFGHTTASQKVNIEKGKDKKLDFNLEAKAWYFYGKKAFYFLMYLYFASPVFVGLYLYLKWKKHGKDPKSKGTVIAQYEPPDHTRPAEMGTLIDEKADLHDITATIIDLAFQGYIRIHEEEDKSLFGKKTDYTFEKRKDFFGDQTLKEYERMILSNLFGSKKEVKLSDLKNKFYKMLKKIKSSLYKDVTALGYFERNPETVRHKYLVVGVVFVAAGWILFLVPAIWGILIIIFGLVMPKKTKKGVQAKWHADGFKKYLHTAERFRLGQLTPETFEKYLSYAMVFKVEKQWAQRFKDIYNQPPDWYVGRGGIEAFAVTSFAANLSDSFNSVVASNLSSSPSSSSGFSGGSAGGGGGGGGASAG
ncbi:MAG: DUF2207 domain-containing protein [Patescibacteria group bacterium]|nr:DUF2207 domain-containing protein [Patescibacteria group bacterium]